MSKTSLRFVGGALVAATLFGCGQGEVGTGTPADTEHRAALSASVAGTLAFPEYDLNAAATNGWVMHFGTADDVNGRLAAGYRLHDLDVVQTSPLRFTGAFVMNDGLYHRVGNGWSYDLTEQDLLDIYADTSRRIVDIAEYQVSGGQWRYAAVWVSNTGTQQRTYKLVLNKVRSVFEAEAAGYRVVSVDKGPWTTCVSPCVLPFETFSGVMIYNVGNDRRTQHFGRSSMAALKKVTSENAAVCSNKNDAGVNTICVRLALIEEMGTDDFYYVTEDVEESASPSGWPILGEGEQTWWASGLFLTPGEREHPDNIEHLLRRFEARLHRIRPYSAPEGTRYIVIFTKNGANIPPPQGLSNNGNAVLNEVDAIAERQMRRMGVPGLSLAIAQDGRLVHAKGYGYSDLQNLRTTQPTDLFHIASVSKALAKGAVARLVQDAPMVTPPGGGAAAPFTLDTKPWGEVWAYNNGSPAGPDLGDITVRDLLLHQTGLRYISPEFCDCATKPNPPMGCDPVNDVSPCNPFNDLSLDTANPPDRRAATPAYWQFVESYLRNLPQPAKPFYMHTAAGQVLNACPGSMVDPTACAMTTPAEYFNSGYHIIGQVIETVSGQSYDSYLRAIFLDPLGLDRVRPGQYHGAPPAGCFVPPFPPTLVHAVGYQLPLPYRDNGGPESHGDFVLCQPKVYPAGGYSAAPVELLRWATSIDGSAPGYQPLDANGKAALEAIKGNFFAASGVEHGGYLPQVGIAAIFDRWFGTTNVKVAFAANGVPMDADYLWSELEALLLAQAGSLPTLDLFSTYVGGCNPNVPESGCGAGQYCTASGACVARPCNLGDPFGALLPVLPSGVHADGFTLSADGKTAYVSDNPNGYYDLYTTTRATTADPFGPLTPLTGVNNPNHDRAPWLSQDGLRLYFWNRGMGSSWDNLVVASRASTTVPFATAPQLLPNVNTNADSSDPFFLPGENVLFFASTRNGSLDLFTATRTGSGFTTPAPLANVNSTDGDERPVLTPDGLTLYFRSRRLSPLNDSDGDVWMATRASLTNAFGAAQHVAGVNSTGSEYPVAVSPDSCTLTFASNRETGLGGTERYRLYKMTRGQPQTTVTVTLNIVGNGSVNTAPFSCSTGNVGTCSAQLTAPSTMILWGNRQGYWSGNCAANGAPGLSTDGVLTVTTANTCTVTFP